MKHTYKAFTLIEISLVMVLISILTTITISLVASIVIRTDVNVAHESLYNALLRAQKLSKNQYQNSQWRVCINNNDNNYVIASGTCSDPLYPEIIQIASNIVVASDQQLDIPFKSINGELDYDNNFIKITLSSGDVSKSILINQNGIIEKEPTNDPEFTTANTPIVTEGLVLNLDAGNLGSYPGLGNIWTDLSPTFMSAELIGATYNSLNPKFFQFNGSNQFARLQNNTILDTQTPTVEVWIKPDSVSQNGFLFEKGNFNTQYSLFLENFSIQWRQRLTNGTLITLSRDRIDRFINTSNWYQIVGTFQSGDQKLYLNGTLSVSDTQSGVIATNSGGVSIGVYGGFSGSRGYYYDGNIAIVRVYDRVLTPIEVQQNFISNKARFGF
jgi:prepilin-type N-terminal cleavage/methylation domain-containing protein